MEGYPTSFLAYVCAVSVVGTVAFLRLAMAEIQWNHRLVIYVILLIALERICCVFLAGFSGVLIFTAACFLVFQSLSSPKLPVQGKAVFITGKAHPEMLLKTAQMPMCLDFLCVV